jgi:hypothetical protein
MDDRDEIKRMLAEKLAAHAEDLADRIVEQGTRSGFAAINLSEEMGKVRKDYTVSAAKQAPAIQESVLVDMFAHVMKPCPFQPGDRVRQTKGSELYVWPQEGQLAVVLEVYPDAKWAVSDGDSKASKEDMLILLVGAGPGPGGKKEERWLAFKVESWRFEKYESQAAKH